MNAPAKPTAYKRSWKNLLINKRYQLRFTLFMVGLSTALMIGLGTWVMRVASEATEVSKISVRGTPCPKVPEIAEQTEDTPLPPMNLDAPPPASDAPPAAPPSEGSADPRKPAEPPKADAKPDEPADPKADDKGERPRAKIQLDPSSITIMQPEAKTPAAPAVPADWGKKVVAHWTCEMKLAGALDDLERGWWQIFYVMVGTGLLLVLFLAAYGLRMTHKVAGPLFKVGLYLGKMRNGRFDKVYNLRKGDQLVSFYDHFKGAHAGIVKMQKDDIAKLSAVIAAAESAGAGDDPVVGQLREMLARKEKSVE